MQDDFYLNLVDWSSHNVLSVGLANCVYLWNACSSKVSCKYFIFFRHIFVCLLMVKDSILGSLVYVGCFSCMEYFDDVFCGLNRNVVCVGD